MHVELWKIAVAAALVVFSFIVYRQTFPPVSPVRRALLVAMRVIAFLLLGLLLINPVFVSTKIETKKPIILVLLDHSRSMGIRDAGGKTRIEEATDALARLRRALRGDSRVKVETIPFANALSAAPAPPDSAITADGEGTDVWGALEAAQRRYRSSNIASIVLLTDGRVTRGMMTAGEDIMVPVYAVGFGDTIEGSDVAIDEVICDRIVYKGTKVPIEAVIRADGFKGSAIEAKLLEGGKVKDSASLDVRKDSEIISASLSYVPETEGEHALSVEVPPVAGEKQKENNVEHLRIDVLKDRIHILYIDQFPDWNMTFVRDLVKRAKRLEAEEVAWTANRGFAVSPGERPWEFPSNAAELGGRDLLIVSDDAKLFDSRQNADVLAAYVAGGGSVLFLADENSPLARAGALALLRPVLPIQRTTSPRVEYSESSVRLSPEAVDDPVTSMLDENGGLDALPPLPGRIAGIAATVGARVPLVLDRGTGNYPFLAIGRYGRGLASAILGFPLWRWKLAGDEGQRIYESFFGGLIQYLAEGAKAPGLALDADRTVYRTGDRIALTAFIGERRPPEGIKGEVRKKGSGGALLVSTTVFEPDPRRKGYYRTEVPPLPPGEYVVTASEVTSSGGGLAGTTSFSVVPVSVEFLKTSRDAALLAQIAQATGGKYLEGSHLDPVVSQLSFKERKVERRDAHELRGNILIFIGVVFFLASEWILRKAWGLV